MAFYYTLTKRLKYRLRQQEITDLLKGVFVDAVCGRNLSIADMDDIVYNRDDFTTVFIFLYDYSLHILDI